MGKRETISMVLLKPFKGTRPFTEEAKNIIAPSTDHLTDETYSKTFMKKTIGII